MRESEKERTKRRVERDGRKQSRGTNGNDEIKQVGLVGAHLTRPVPELTVSSSVTAVVGSRRALGSAHGVDAGGGGRSTTLEGDEVFRVVSLDTYRRQKGKEGVQKSEFS